ncbi:MAG: hypothetical protein IJ124_10470 [Clostridia bacterium]|nr:hypothetical protein [Clostridia bacterium]MBQ9719743.1 hypothetical protein [Oscillospiraceae bacterium]
MRIEWKEDNARAVAVSLERIQQELEQCLQQARQVEEALREADPDGSNKRIRKIDAKFEAAVGRLNRIAEDTAELESATNYMIRSFEDSESEVIRLLNNLDPGKGTQERTAEASAGFIPAGRVIPHVVPPIMFPRPRIAPVMRFSALGPTLGWLMRLLNRI